MIKLIEQMFMVSVAYVIAFASGFLAGKGVNLPWPVDIGFCAAFAMSIVIYGALEKK